jgi:hypothetical protein
VKGQSGLSRFIRTDRPAGEWVLTQVWGRRGTQLGRIVHNPCVSYEEGHELLAAVQVRRR